MWNIWFFCFEIWLVVFCLLRMSNGCPLISQLWWRGQKRREFSNWFPTFRTLNKLVYSVHTVWHLRQQRKTTFSSSNYKTNKKQQKHDNVFSSTYQQEIWHVFPSQYLLDIHNLKTFNYFTTVLLLLLNIQKINKKPLNEIYHDLNIYILISDDDQPNLKKQFDQYWPTSYEFWAKKERFFLQNLPILGKNSQFHFLKLTFTWNSSLEREQFDFGNEQWKTYLAMESKKYHINGKSMEENL